MERTNTTNFTVKVQDNGNMDFRMFITDNESGNTYSSNIRGHCPNDELVINLFQDTTHKDKWFVELDILDIQEV